MNFNVEVKNEMLSMKNQEINTGLAVSTSLNFQ